MGRPKKPKHGQMLRDVRKKLEGITKEVAKNPNASTLIFHAADSVLIGVISDRFLDRNFSFSYTAQQAAIDYWGCFWLSGLMPLVFADSVFRSLTGWLKDPANPADQGPFVNKIRDALWLDWDGCASKGMTYWRPSITTRALLAAMMCVMAPIAIETLKGMAAMGAAFGEVIPG